MAYSREDFRQSTPPRIMAGETEYTMNVPSGDFRIRPNLKVVNGYNELSRSEDGNEVWLENGARFYVDAGGVVEYAAPETTSAYEAMLYERAGEQIMRAVADTHAERTNNPKETAYKRSGYSEVKIGKKTVLYPLSAGHHEHYSVGVKFRNSKDVYISRLPQNRSLESYLVSRGAWAGSGMVTKDGFELTQKGEAINFENIGKGSQYGAKAAYLFHDGRQSDELEIRLGDGNMSEQVIHLKYAFTSVVLRMIEHGVFPHTLWIEEGTANQALRNTARGQTIQTVSGPLSAAQHQRRIAYAAQDFAASQPDIPYEEAQAAREVYRICQILEEIDSSLEGASILADTVDWAAKLTYLRDKDIGEVSTQNLDAVAIDLKWEDIARNGIARTWYQNRDATLATDEEITKAMIAPPLTRALARTTRLAIADPAKLRAITWGRVDEDGRKLTSLPDPWCPELPKAS